MLAPFDINKLTQACGVLLREEPKQCATRLRLLKLLYIADREMIQERARPITGDSVAAMDHGPVLSNTYDLIKGSQVHHCWAQHIHSERLSVSLIGDPGIDLLTRREIAKLQEVSARFVGANDYTLADYTHGFDEWKRHKPEKGSRNMIPVEDVLTATGHAEDADDLLSLSIAEKRLFRMAAGR
jgi:uncharacterized phage-associated protein